MKLANYEKNGLTRAGIVEDGKIYEISLGTGKTGAKELTAINSVDELLDETLLAAVMKAESRLTQGKGTPLKSVRLKSPVLYPEKIFMVAVNYGAHGKETNTPLPEYPYLFTKFRNAIIGPEDPILLPSSSKKVDWEVELAVVIGREGKDIKKTKAYDYVAGYTVSNDVSYRDFQGQRNEKLGLNWVKGKGMDASLPMGPWLVTRDEIPEPHSLDISLSVNGDRKQHSNTKDMLFKIDELIAYASIGTTLRPGDIISTGTPDGIAAATGQPYLKDGDVVEAKVGKIGTLRNPVKG
ncbi:MAG: fumarylacetoacetate hydrolase family protein [Thaumarchaeota archaeon]|nr:fumarylacetoacetate hydrolase family protein [Nitrososphaerota archaeon]